MIEAKDLRVGNCIKSFVKDDWVLNVVDPQNIEDCYCDNSFFNKYYQAIPLTSDVLEKCGGKQVSLMDDTSLQWRIGDFIIKDWEIERLKYLHVLQNWYYYRTFGEELEYKQ